MPLRPDMEMVEYLEILRRRKWYIVFSILLILFGASVYCVVTPEKYSSSTTILVIPQRVPEGYVRSTVSTGVDERLFTIQQQVMSRTRLVSVMEELGLLKEERKSKPLEEVVEEMRKRIDIKIASNTQRRRGNSGEDAFTLTFVHESPQMAMLTASRLASYFIDENLKSREQQAVGTADFLESQLKETKQRLEGQEERVKQYKLRFSGELPQQLQANLQVLSRLQDQMKANSDATRSAMDRKVFIEAQIGAFEAQLSVLETQAKAMSMSVGKEGATADERRDPTDPIASIFIELQAKKSQLASYSAKYTDSYPEIRRLKDEIAQLEKRLEEEQRIASAAIARPADNVTRRTVSGSTGRAGPGAREREEILRLRAQNTAIDAEIASLKMDRDLIQRNMAALEAKVEKAPQREQEMIAITRDYENTKNQYDELLKKRLDAQVAQNLEIRQKGEQFQILDPANLPQSPFIPNRAKVFGIALAAALLVGFGGAIGMEMVDPSLRGKRDFQHFFQVPVIASIPILHDEQYERRLFRKKFFIYSGIISFSVAVTVFLALFGQKVRSILEKVIS